MPNKGKEKVMLKFPLIKSLSTKEIKDTKTNFLSCYIQILIYVQWKFMLFFFRWYESLEVAKPVLYLSQSCHFKYVVFLEKVVSNSFTKPLANSTISKGAI